MVAMLTVAIGGCLKKPSATYVPARGEVFTDRCVICHQAQGQGVAGMYPPIADSIGNYVRVKDGRQYLVHVLLNGLSGPLDVKGATYNGLMPQFASLSDEDIAEALNEVLERFNSSQLPADFQPITPDEVRAGRAITVTPAQLKNERAQILDQLKNVATGSATP